MNGLQTLNKNSTVMNSKKKTTNETSGTQQLCRLWIGLKLCIFMQTMLSKLILAMNGMDYWFPENQENYCPEKINQLLILYVQIVPTFCN